jgi:hypothetical protein
MQTRAAAVIKELLALDDIAPSWSKRLQNLPASKWSPRWLLWHSDIASRENCIVGEAFGRSASYWDSCMECRAFSKRFPRYLKDRAYRELDRDVQRFVEHWNDRHRDAVIEHRNLRWFDSFVRFDGYIRTYR